MIRLALLLLLQAPVLPGGVDYPQPRFRTDSLATQLVQGWVDREAKPISCVWGHVAQSEEVGRYLQFDSLELRGLSAETPDSTVCRGAVAVLKFINRRPAGMPEALFYAGLREQLAAVLQTRPDLLLLGVVHDTQRVMLTVAGDHTGKRQRPDFVTVPQTFWLIRTNGPPTERPKRT